MADLAEERTDAPKAAPREEGRPDGPPRRRERGPGGAGRPRFSRGRGRRKVGRFCADKSLVLDYKWSHALQSFITERGRIVPSRTSGTCAKHQRRLTRAIKRARNVALLAYKRA